MQRRKLGVWLIGAFGSISTTVILGTLALRKGLIGPTGMITETEPFKALGLVPLEAIEFAGCDIRAGTMRGAAQHNCPAIPIIDSAFLSAVADDLDRVGEHIQRGSVRNCGEAIGNLATDATGYKDSVRDEIALVVGHLNEFKEAKGLDDVVVVNVASTEPPLKLQRLHNDLAMFEASLDRSDDHAVRASTIYAYAAIQTGCPYINFTPSTGALFPAMVQLAEQKGVPVMGNDGKTGETLVKSALAPMFTCRALEILSWEGFNILGNMDGQVLDCAENRESKIKSKDTALSKILGYPVHSQVHINYVPSLCDQKTAWDFIHFEGFLGAKMSLQFVWQGYDSLLAAPLILDLVRLADLAKKRGEAGLMPHLASYFKDPIGVQEHRLYQQFMMLIDYVKQVREHGPIQKDQR